MNKNYNMAMQVAKYLTARQQRLAVAESCTGGGIGACLTDLPGSSAWFCGGIISYSNQAKVDLLNVSEADLNNYGAVNQHIAESMALAVLARLKADISIAVTGIAGPSGGDSKPVGTVWVAWGYIKPTKNTPLPRPSVCSQHFLFTGGRHVIRQKTIYQALKGVMTRLDGEN